MSQNRKVYLICRIICLITFAVVILQERSVLALSLLTIVFYLFTRNTNDLIIFLGHIFTFAIFLISYFVHDFFWLQMILICDLCYYFLSIPSLNTKRDDNYIVNKYFIRFAFKKRKRKDEVNNNMFSTVYVTVHLLILFTIIMVGSCDI